jgi:uncharacterized RmlC-like cupin family protein
MATVIRGKDLKFSDHHQKTSGNIQFGIYDKTVADPKMVMGHTIGPPGERGRRHYHTNCSVGMYRIKGRTRYFVGPDDDIKEIDIGPGDFLFIPRGEIHGSLNLSETEPVELVFCYIGVNSPEEAKTVFAEPPLK